MNNKVKLDHETSFFLSPNSPYNFDANFHKPSHFPDSGNIWEKGKHWITMLWGEEVLGLKFEDKGSLDNPKIKLIIYSQNKLSNEFIESATEEIRWRFNFNQDLSEFYKRYSNDKHLSNIIKKWKGMKPIAANSLYETFIIYFVLQNASVRRSVQMLEALFDKYGKKVLFDDKEVSCFWKPEEILKSSEEELRSLKIGYRAKFIMVLSEQFANGEVDELKLRNSTKEEVKNRVLKLYGVGPATVEYLLFDDFYFLDALETIPPWEQKIFSKLIFNKPLVLPDKILGFFKERYENYSKLANHYLWEDLFWRHKEDNIDWLEKEIRL